MSENDENAMTEEQARAYYVPGKKVRSKVTGRHDMTVLLVRDGSMICYWMWHGTLKANVFPCNPDVWEVVG